MKKENSANHEAYQENQTRLLCGKVSALLGVLILLLISTASAQTAFTYQGRLQQDGKPADGTFQMLFEIYDNSGASGSPLDSTTDDVNISDGLFTVELDFGSPVFDGNPRWLQIGVREDSGGTYTFMSPAQSLTASPYAIYALNGPPVPTVPVGIIVMWSGDRADIPSGWALCDGSEGTPDLSDRFVLSIGDTEEPGTYGGSNSHGHSIEIAGEHAHSGTTGHSNNNLTIAHGNDFEGVRQEHSHNFNTNPAGSHTHNMTISTHLPPYFKMAFIMKVQE